MNMHAKSYRYGFTIVELLIVIVAIAILAAITIIAYSGIQRQAVAGSLRADLVNAAKQLEIEKITSNQYPSTHTGLKKSDGTQFQYTASGTSYCLTATSVTTSGLSFFISSDSGTVTEGVCPGHTAGGELSIPSNELANLTANDAGAWHNLGLAIAVSGDTAVFGATGVDDNRGAAYVFIRSGSTWTQQAKLLAADGASQDYFGRSVAIDGDTILVGAYWNDSTGSDAGAAYVFTRSGTSWTQQAKLVADDAIADTFFGVSAALDGDTALVGSADTNAAYVFTRSGTSWTQQAKLTSNDTESDDYFSYSLSLDGDTALIGTAVNGDVYAGAAYIFTRSGTAWSQQAILTPSDSVIGNGFGVQVSLDAGTAAIIADTLNANTGAVYVFTGSGSTWTQQAKLVMSDAASDDWLSGVDVKGDLLAVGAMAKDSYLGAAYVFSRSGSAWTESEKLTASDGVSGDGLGTSIAFGADFLMVGAGYNDTSASETGSVYVFN